MKNNKGNLLKLTKHAREKMNYYNISENKIKTILRNPFFVKRDYPEKGIVVAMKPKSIKINRETKNKTWNAEVWIMYKYIEEVKLNPNLNIQNKLKNLINKPEVLIISCWIFPGKTLSKDDFNDIEGEIFEGMNFLES